MYLKCFHPKLNHDNIIEALMMALIAIGGITIYLIYNLYNTILLQHGYRHADGYYILRSFVYLCQQEHQRVINY